MGQLRRTKKIPHAGDREKFLLNVASGLRVAHLGCTDWPYQVEQIEARNFLHFKLRNVSKDLLGIDVDKEGIDYLREIDAHQKYILGDCSTSYSVFSEILNFRPDVILVPDVLEHVKNQETFLKTIFQLRRISNAKLYISTPNAFSFKTLVPFLLRIELSHPDHRFLHNESTLNRALEDVSENDSWKIFGTQRDIAPRYGKIMQFLSSPLNLVSRVLPEFCDTLIVEVN